MNSQRSAWGQFMVLSLLAVGELACASGSQVHVFRTPEVSRSVAMLDDRTLCSEQARRTYPDARSRFQAGLPRDQVMYVYAPLHRDNGKSEVALISVWLIQHGYVSGMIEGEAVSQLSSGDWYAMPESELIDWVIVHADGSEEGHAAAQCAEAPTVEHGQSEVE